MSAMSPASTVTDKIDTLVIGTGPAGLATAACLLKHGVPVLVIDRSTDVGASWRGHYDRLHLHTVNTHSALPGLPFPKGTPSYVSRQAMVDYLCAYAEHHGLSPELGQDVVSIEPEVMTGLEVSTGPEVSLQPVSTSVACGSARWIATTTSGRRFRSRRVVIATGANREPCMPSLPGLADFRGTVLHSCGYRNAEPFAGRRVLVVGMGNTGAEIALDLVEHGVKPALSVRSPLNIVYRDMFGRPTQLTSIALSKLPVPIADQLARLARDLTVGDLSRWGIRTSAVSPMRQLREEGRTPVIDVGTIARIKSGDIVIHPGIDRLVPDGVRFTDGTHALIDTVLLATGYRPGLQRLFPKTRLDLGVREMPVSMIGQGALAGIYFVGFDTRQPVGVLQTIAKQAKTLADYIAAGR
jgi:cation diffusion facilitator CzcD-associated flavoprotein CzcO